MKKALIAAIILTATATAASAQYQQRGYGGYGRQQGYGSSGSSTYVAPSYNSNTGNTTSGHYRTTPNNTQMDNYGTRGNVNPYSGQTGTRRPNY